MRVAVSPRARLRSNKTPVRLRGGPGAFFLVDVACSGCSRIAKVAYRVARDMGTGPEPESYTFSRRVCFSRVTQFDPRARIAAACRSLASHLVRGRRSATDLIGSLAGLEVIGNARRESLVAVVDAAQALQLKRISVAPIGGADREI